MNVSQSKIWLRIAAVCLPLMVSSPLVANAQNLSSAATKTVTDNLGQHQIPVTPQKLVVFNPAILDTLDALGVPVAAVPKVETSLPPFLAKYKGKTYLNAGSMFEPDFEALSQFKPDVIIGGGRTTNADKELNNIAPTLNFDRDDKQFPESLRLQTLKLGEVFNKQAEAKQLVARFDQQLKDVRPRSQNAGTALIMIVTGGKMSAFGPGSRFGFIYDGLGFKPAITLGQPGKHGNALSAELVHEANPDWIFVIDRDAAIGFPNAKPAAQVLNNPLVNSTNAAKKQHIIYLNASELYVAGGMTTFIHALTDVDNALKTAQSR